MFFSIISCLSCQRVAAILLILFFFLIKYLGNLGKGYAAYSRLFKSFRYTPAQKELSYQGKFQQLCNWMKNHRNEIATVLKTIGIAALSFAVAALLFIFLTTPLGSAAYFFGFIRNFFTYNPLPSGAITGLSATGSLFFASIGCLFGGAALASFGSGLY